MDSSIRGDSSVAVDWPERSEWKDSIILFVDSLTGTVVKARLCDLERVLLARLAARATSRAAA